MFSPENINSEITEAIFSAVPDPFFVFDEFGHYVRIIGGIDRRKYHDGQHLIGKKIHDVMSDDLADEFVRQIRKAIEEEGVISYRYKLSAMDIKGSETLSGPCGEQWFEANISPIKKVCGQPRMVVWISFNVTDLHNTIKEKESLIEELQKADKEIKALREIVPIYSYCKKIRDDSGYWNQVEYYISQRTGAELSHGICQDCATQHYSEFVSDQD